MGLDQSAYAREQPSGEHIGGDKHPFYWRKHARLQSWMQRKYYEKQDTTGTPCSGDFAEFNCVPLSLNQSDIDELKCHLEAGLPESEGGFFWGHQFQGESAKKYREQDLAFCAWADQELANGNEVIYYCWW